MDGQQRTAGAHAAPQRVREVGRAADARPWGRGGRRRRAREGGRHATIARDALGGQPRPALRAAAREDLATRSRTHPDPEAVRLRAATVVGLVGPLGHGRCSRDGARRNVPGAPREYTGGDSPPLRARGEAFVGGDHSAVPRPGGLSHRWKKVVNTPEPPCRAADRGSYNPRAPPPPASLPSFPRGSAAAYPHLLTTMGINVASAVSPR